MSSNLSTIVVQAPIAELTRVQARHTPRLPTSCHDVTSCPCPQCLVVPHRPPSGCPHQPQKNARPPGLGGLAGLLGLAPPRFMKHSAPPRSEERCAKRYHEESTPFTKTRHMSDGGGSASDAIRRGRACPPPRVVEQSAASSAR